MTKRNCALIFSLAITLQDRNFCRELATSVSSVYTFAKDKQVLTISDAKYSVFWTAEATVIFLKED